MSSEISKFFQQYNNGKTVIVVSSKSNSKSWSLFNDCKFSILRSEDYDTLMESIPDDSLDNFEVIQTYSKSTNLSGKDLSRLIQSNNISYAFYDKDIDMCGSD